MNLSMKQNIILVWVFFVTTSVASAGIFSLPKLPFPRVFKKQDTGLAISWHEIHPSDQDEMSGKIHALVDGLCKKIGVSKPMLVIYSGKDEYNLLATVDGKKRNYVVALGGLLVGKWKEGWLSDQEIEAGLAHELCHIKYKHLIKAGLLNLVMDGPEILNKLTSFPGSPKLLVKNIFFRQSEKEADLKSIEAIGDPLDMVHLLVKLHCLNQLPFKKSQSKQVFDFECSIAEQELIKDEKSFIAPIIEVLSDHPLTSKRIVYIKKGRA